jgi:hypothetical protein
MVFVEQAACSISANLEEYGSHGTCSVNSTDWNAPDWS